MRTLTCGAGQRGVCGCAVLMVLYEFWWIGYFRSEKAMRDFYSSLLGIPVVGATLPVLAFLMLGIYGRNPCMIAQMLFWVLDTLEST